MDEIVSLREKDPLKSWQVDYIAAFITEIQEPHWFRELLKDDFIYRVPLDSRIWFYKRGLWPAGFLWAQRQRGENGVDIIRAHACHINSHVSKKKSDKIMKAFEKSLDEYAREHGIKHIGFYTKRNPDAFSRRLNRTSPRTWILDSYVFTRRV